MLTGWQRRGRVPIERFRESSGQRSVPPAWNVSRQGRRRQLAPSIQSRT